MSAGRHAVRLKVERMLDGLASLTVEQTVVLAEAWSEQDEAVRRRAWQKARPAIARAGLDDVLERARSDVAAWLLAEQAEYQGIGGLLGRVSDDAYLRRVAAPAVLDAVAGFLAERDLHGEDADVLLRPWREANAVPAAAEATPDVGHWDEEAD